MYVVLPYRTDLIDEEIENAVARMQSVIELGRYIRDVKVLPTKVTLVMHALCSLAKAKISLPSLHNLPPYLQFPLQITSCPCNHLTSSTPPLQITSCPLQSPPPSTPLQFPLQTTYCPL